MDHDGKNARPEARLDELWNEIEPPTIGEACCGCGSVDDTTLQRIFLDDLKRRVRYRLKFNFEEYELAVGGLRDRPYAATAVFVHEIQRDRPIRPDEWARARKADLPEYASAIESAFEIADLHPVRDLFAEGRYVEIDRLGSGGFGRVIRARDTTTEGVVALKVFNIDGDDPRFEEALRRFARESELLGRLAHRSITRLIDINLEARPPFLVLDYVEGCDLAMRIVREAECRNRLKGIGEERAIRWVEKGVRLIEAAARAVHFAHLEGVLHRDLKPANIIESPTAGPMLIDFGLAAEMRAAAEKSQSDRSVSSPREFRGTPEYAAPETIPTIGRRPFSDRRTDVYGLGAVLYSWIALRPPFLRDTHSETLDAVLRDDPPPLPQFCTHVSHDLELVVRRAMAKDPAERYTTAEAFADDLARVVNRERPKARPFSLGYRVRRYFRRDPKVATATVVTLAALLLATGVSLWNLRESRLSETAIRAAKDRADTAARESKTEAERARTAERDLRRAVAAEYQARMDTAVFRGDHREFLRLSDFVVADPESDRPATRLQRVRSALAEAQFDVAHRDLAHLSTTRLNPLEQALFDLLYGERMFLENGKADEARASIEKALASGKLTRADDAYARGLIAPTTREAAAAFREGIVENPAHRGCRMGAAFVAMICGNTEQALIDAAGMASIFPTDAFPNFVRVWCGAIDDNAAAVEEALAGIRAQHGEKRAEAVARFFDRFGLALSIGKAAQTRGQIGATTPTNILSVARSLQQSGEEIQGVGVEAAVVARLDSWAKVLRETVRMRQIGSKLDIAKIDRLAYDHPDGYLMTLAAEARATSAMAALEAGGFRASKEVIAKWSDTFACMLKAMRTPSFVKDSRRTSAQGAVQLGGMLARPDMHFEKPESFEDDVDEATTIFLRERRPNDPDLRFVVTTAIDSGPLPSRSMRRLLRAWEKEEPRSADVVVARIRFEIFDERVSAARSLLEDFHAQYPGDARRGDLEIELSKAIEKIFATATSQPASQPTTQPRPK